MPERIRLSRMKGWRMPPDTVKVDRTTPWGNPFRVGVTTCNCRSVGKCEHGAFLVGDAAAAVEAYRSIPRTDARRAQIKRLLGGKNLACWCLPGTPCHADVLLELANG